MTTATIGYVGPAVDYQAAYERETNSEVKPRRSRKSNTSRRSSRPAGFNGLHRRRARRWAW